MFMEFHPAKTVDCPRNPHLLASAPSVMSEQPTYLYLIDGSSYLYRAFFALPPLTSPGGLPTNAVYGFTTMLLKLLSDTQPKYLTVVFDAPGKTFRDDIYGEYKAHRPVTPADLTAQIPYVRRVIETFRIHMLSVPGVEADDVIGTLTARLSNEIQCVVITADKDLMQLVGPHVQLWDTMRDRRVDAAGVKARLGVEPQQVVDVMALMGDSVDNVPGVKGIGEKTAVTLIREFGDLDGLLKHLDRVEALKVRGAKKIAERLREGREQALLSRDLVRIRCDVPLECPLEELRYRGPDREALRELFNQLGFQSLSAQVSATAPPIQASAVAVRDPKEVEALFARAEAQGRLALVTLGEAGPAATSPAQHLLVANLDGPPALLALAEEGAGAVIRERLGEPRFLVVGHDLKQDFLRLQAAGIPVRGKGFDLMVASYLLEATATHSLEELASRYLGARLAGFRGDSDTSVAGVTVMQALAARMEEELRQNELDRLFEQVEMPLVKVLTSIERRGLLVDVDHLRAMSDEFSQRLEALMKEIHALAGEEFNINSPPQLRTVLFEKLGLSKKGVRKGKTGYSTDVDVLTRLAKEHALPEKILAYRALSKLKSTYLDALPAAVNPVSGRLHTSLNQTVAATGRLSSSDPNLQNIPIRGEEGRRIRGAFIAPPQHVLLAADYSQIELRVLAHFSRDPALLEAFRTGQDVHTRTAVEVFGVLPGAVSADQRRAAKVINFGILYGMGPQRLAQELAIPMAEAQRYIGNYFARYAGVRSFMQRVVEEGRERGYVKTILGRRRAVPELRSTERGVAQAAERVAANTPIQGSAADIIKLAMVAVDRRLTQMGLRAALLLQVHDELLLEVHEADREVTGQVLREEMEGALSLDVPLRVDIGFGRSWAEAH